MERQVIDSSLVNECAEELQIPGERRVIPGERPAGRSGAPASEHRKANRFVASPAILTVLILAAILAAGYFMFTGNKITSLPWSPDQLVPGGPPSVNLNKPEPSTVEQQAPTASNTTPQRLLLPEDTNEDKGAGTNPGIAKSNPDATESLFNLSKVKKVVIRFDHNSNELPPNAYAPLERFATSLLKNPDIGVLINGYTDNTGELSYNLSISEFRANMVKGYLVGKGVAPSRISVKGLGPTDPIGSNTTEEGRSLNRRVEVLFVKNTPG
jgi:outer membrane protein OmpA-like peptidoglycan-associated protein